MQLRLLLSICLLLPAGIADAESRRDARAQAQVLRLEQALEFFRLDLGRYPTTEEGLEALVSCPQTANCASFNSAGYIKAESLIDPWGARFRYAYPPTRNEAVPDVWTLGADSSEGGAGVAADSGNWPGGFNEYERAREMRGMFPLSAIGAAFGLALGTPIYLWGIWTARAGKRSWRSALLGEPLGIAIYLILSCALVTFLLAVA